MPSLRWHGLKARRSESARSSFRLLANAPNVAYRDCVTGRSTDTSKAYHLLARTRSRCWPVSLRMKGSLRGGGRVKECFFGGQTCPAGVGRRGSRLLARPDNGEIDIG